MKYNHNLQGITTLKVKSAIASVGFIEFRGSSGDVKKHGIVQINGQLPSIL